MTNHKEFVNLDCIIRQNNELILMNKKRFEYFRLESMCIYIALVRPCGSSKMYVYMATLESLEKYALKWQ